MSTERYKPGILEQWGRRVLISLRTTAKKEETKGETRFSDVSKRLLFWGSFWSFWIGFFPSVLFVYLSVFLPSFSWETFPKISYEGLFWFLTLLTIVTVIEFYLLFRLGFYLSYQMAKAADMELADEPELITPIPGMMARLVLEIPDPRIRLYGIDPYKHLNERALFFRTVLYKSKVFLSNVFAKLMLKVILGRTSLRFLIEYISGPITGIWDAVTTYIILFELRKRIITRKLADSILLQIKSKTRNPKLIESVLRSVALSIVYTKTFHPNFEYLLFGLLGLLPNRENLGNLDDWEHFVLSLQGLSKEEKKWPVSVFAICASFDGKLNAEELNAFVGLSEHSPNWIFEQVRFLSATIQKGKLSESFLSMEKILPKEGKT
ncbi:hypothetical protein EHQ59_10555 [Leptospira kemamanensis]|uniref:Uncharacterized protein n=1 Tax=Leptospira kemamanensis TaxID=2484942 RepID=A0A4R9JQ20_9LEPT|nr:hypothetical protein [Leptospira kemamanensis]TGL51339.1 hypothetical protein EHQ59_10555 [Leptospira kemamanensis]